MNMISYKLVYAIGSLITACAGLARSHTEHRHQAVRNELLRRAYEEDWKVLKLGDDTISMVAPANEEEVVAEDGG